MLTKSQTIKQLFTIHEDICVDVLKETDVSKLAHELDEQLSEQIISLVGQYQEGLISAAEFVDGINLVDNS